MLKYERLRRKEKIMPLPNDSVAANTLPEVTTIPTGKKLIFTDPDTNEGGIITLENLTKQILQNLTSQTFSLDQGTKTLVQALNELNSNTPRIKFNGNINRMTFRSGSDGISNVYFDFYTNDGKRTTINFYTDGSNGIQMTKDDTVIWTMKP